VKEQSTIDSFRFAKLIPFVHIKADGPTTAVLWVLCAMARGKTNKDYEAGTCDPSIPYIAIRTQLSSSTVKRSLKKLAQAGLITVRVRGTADHHQSNLYKLEYDKLRTVLRACKDAEEEYLQTVRDNWSATKRKKRGGCLAQGDPDKGSDVRVKSEECPVQCDTLTTYNSGLTTGTTKELEADASDISGSIELEANVTEEPASREAQIRQTQASIGGWEYEVQKAIDRGSPHVRVFETRLQAARQRLSRLLDTPAETACAA
jgi:DNA-binding transcriptional ArsR family regulator